jgi:2-dehydro-3-deoxygalactonokinase
MTNRNEARLIALDWGTSVCRAYLVGDGGAVLAERREPSGIMTVVPRASSTERSYERAFDRTFEKLCAEWLTSDPEIPVIACGMVGSNHGWAEAKYRRVPTDLMERSVALTTVRTRIGATVHIIPGLIAEGVVPDVMRGEETQILGALVENLRDGTLDSSADRIVMLPGTHSKWVRVAGTTVTDFTTCMTGEFYAWLTTDSTLSRLALRAETADWEAFDRGLDVVASPIGRGGILRTAFSARTLVLTGQLAPDQVDDYVSGLLIGHELAGIATSWLAPAPALAPVHVLLCGDPNLNNRYRRALERLEVNATLAGSNSAPTGMWQVALATGLVRAADGDGSLVPDASRAAGFDTERLDSELTS